MTRGEKRNLLRLVYRLETLAELARNGAGLAIPIAVDTGGAR